MNKYCYNEQQFVHTLTEHYADCQHRIFQWQ